MEMKFSFAHFVEQPRQEQRIKTMARQYICDNCHVKFIVRNDRTCQYGDGRDLCPDCGLKYQKWAFRDTRTAQEKIQNRERRERLDRSYR